MPNALKSSCFNKSNNDATSSEMKKRFFMSDWNNVKCEVISEHDPNNRISSTLKSNDLTLEEIHKKEKSVFKRMKEKTSK